MPNIFSEGVMASAGGDKEDEGHQDSSGKGDSAGEGYPLGEPDSEGDTNLPDDRGDGDPKPLKF